jgi:hypothetical protein
VEILIRRRARKKQQKRTEEVKRSKRNDPDASTIN